MVSTAIGHDIDGGVLLRDALERVESVEGELVIDFSGVRRIDTAALRGIAELTAKARERGVKLVARGVSVGIYKVLKLTALAGEFAFYN